MTDLVAGAGVTFIRRDPRELKGLPGTLGPIRRRLNIKSSPGLLQLLAERLPQRVINVISGLRLSLPVWPHKPTFCCGTISVAVGQSRRFRAAKKQRAFSPSDHHEVSHNLLQHSAQFPPAAMCCATHTASKLVTGWVFAG